VLLKRIRLRIILEWNRVTWTWYALEEHYKDQALIPGYLNPISTFASDIFSEISKDAFDLASNFYLGFESLAQIRSCLLETIQNLNVSCSNESDPVSAPCIPRGIMSNMLSTTLNANFIHAIRRVAEKRLYFYSHTPNSSCDSAKAQVKSDLNELNSKLKAEATENEKKPFNLLSETFSRPIRKLIRDINGFECEKTVILSLPMPKDHTPKDAGSKEQSITEK
jgi:hypothetical protein